MKKPLHGLRILNTRPLEQGLALHQAISDAGGISVDLPAIAIEPTANDWLKKLPNLDTLNQAIFISSNAATHFYSALKQQQLAWPSAIKITAIGNASASALEKWNIRIDNCPLIADSEHLLQLEILQQVQNQTILLVKGVGGRMHIATTLQKRGAKLISLDVYQRVLPTTQQNSIYSVWHDDLVDIILFTSHEAMHNLFSLFGDSARSWLCSKPCMVISERLAEAAFMLGIQAIILSRYDTMLSTLEHYNKDRAQNSFPFWRPNQGSTHGNQQ